MKIVVLTSNALRHKYVANMLSEAAGEALIVSEVKPHDSVADLQTTKTPFDEHWRQRFEAEKIFFAGHDAFKSPVVPIVYKEAGLPCVYEVVKKFKPEALFVFGASLLKEPLLSVAAAPFVNLHLGLSPYYRGSGTNFWPFVNKELEYVGSTILHIDAGVDTGDIIAHVRPVFEENDTVHSAGCKVIKASAAALVKILRDIKTGKKLNRVPQWKEAQPRVYKKADFTLQALETYRKNIQEGLLKTYLAKPKTPRLISF